MTSEDLKYASEIRMVSSITGVVRLAQRENPGDSWLVTGFVTPLSTSLLLMTHEQVEVLAEFPRPRLRDIIWENIHVYQYPAKDRPGWNLFYRLSEAGGALWFDTTTRSHFRSIESLEDHLIQEGVDLTDIVGLHRVEAEVPF